MLDLETILSAMDQIHDAYSAGPATFYLSPRMHDHLRYLERHQCMFPEPPRKLRKCHMRKRQRRIQQDRKRYFARKDRNIG